MVGGISWSREYELYTRNLKGPIVAAAVKVCLVAVKGHIESLARLPSPSSSCRLYLILPGTPFQLSPVCCSSFTAFSLLSLFARAKCLPLIPATFPISQSLRRVFLSIVMDVLAPFKDTVLTADYLSERSFERHRITLLKK